MAAGDYDHLLEKVAKALRKALRQQAFEMAEKLIRIFRHPICLNGIADRHSPLTLVLSGTAGYFNLHLAALLVQRGADLNLENTRKSPLEYVIKLHQDTKSLCDEQETSCSRLSRLIIGLHGERNPPPLELKEQLSVLLDMFLSSGANPNLITSLCTSSIFHRVVAVENPDIDMVMKLYQWGGTWNTGDAHGTTPLMDHITKASRDRGFPLVDKILSEGIWLDLNHTNFKKETMLWRAMLAGSPATAVLLLQVGADPTIEAIHSDNTSLSPIFAPLLQSSALSSSLSNRSFSSFTVAELNKVMLCSVFPVVDCTDICDSICENLEKELSNTFFPMPCLTEQGNCPRDVAFLMLGHFKAGLQQLCVRRIMEHLIMMKHYLWNISHGVTTMNTLMKNCLLCGSSKENRSPWVLVGLLKPQMIAILTRDLGLPTAIEPRFLIEAARLQVGAYFFDTRFWSIVTFSSFSELSLSRLRDVYKQ